MSKRIAIITARGGSKRIPKKNIKDFLGKPIIAYSIEAALQAEIYDEVMVSTDSQEIADIAKRYGAEVPFMRSEKTADDFATTADVLLEVFDEYEKRGEIFDYATCIYPTAPFVTGQKLRGAMELLVNSRAAEVIPVVAFSYPPQRGYIIKDERLSMKQPEYLMTRSQDLETIYHDAGQFYCYDVKKYRALDGKIADGLVPFILREMDVQDIDNEEDWKLAELKYRMLLEERGHE